MLVCQQSLIFAYNVSALPHIGTHYYPIATRNGATLMTIQISDENMNLARDLHKLGTTYFTYDRNDRRLLGHYSAGICYALSALNKSEGNLDNRPYAYEIVDRLLRAAEGTYDPGDYLQCVLEEDDSPWGWEPRAWMCLFLTHWILDGNFESA